MTWLDQYPVIHDAPEPRLISRADAAIRCGISPAVFSAWVADGLLPAATIGHRWDVKAINLALKRLDPLLFDNNVYTSRVYFIECDRFCKIGFSGDPTWRMANLQESNPFELRLLHTIRGDHRTEGKLHHRFAAVRARGEWFHKTTSLLAYVDWLKVLHP